MFIKPNWPAPKNIHAYTTLRSGGVSLPPFDQFNLAEHVGDFPEHVRANRELLKSKLKLPSEPIWINQTHSTIVIPAKPENREQEADASFTDQKNNICIILTADCLPILICHRHGQHVAAIHAGWRGLLNGIIETTLEAINRSFYHETSPKNEDLLVWLGPAISSANYEVGEEVRNQFIAVDPENEKAFFPTSHKHWLADLYALAKLRFLKAGVSAIYGGEFCTYSDLKHFYSYRRDGSKTGRMATLIWIND